MSDLELSLVIKAVDRMTSPMRGMLGTVERFSKGVQKSVTRLREAFNRSGFGSISKNAQQLVGATGRAVKASRTLALAGAGFLAITGVAFKKFFIDTAAGFEKYQIMLTSLEGSNAKAQAAMDWVGKFAVKTPFELDGIMEAFVKLKTFGIDPMNGSMQSIVDQTAKLGGGQEKLEGIVLALGQAWTKQKLQGEEALQLIERGVPVWDLLHEATGRSVRDLQQMSAKGLLGRKAIQLLIDAMGKNAAGSATAQMQSWGGMVSNIADQWTRFSNMVMAAGVFDFLKEKLGGFLERLNALADSGQLKTIAEQVGRTLVNALGQLWDMLREGISVAKTAWGWLQQLRDIFGSWKPIIVAVAAVIAGPLLAAVALMTKAIIGLSIAMLTTPVGWIIAAVAAIVAALVAAAVAIYRNWGSIKSFFVNTTQAFVATIARAFQIAWRVFTQPFDALLAILKALKVAFPAAAAFIARFVDSAKIAFGFLGEVFTRPFNVLFGLIKKAQTLLPQSILNSVGLGSAEIKTINREDVNAKVGGTIRVQIDSEGRPRVRELSSKGIELDAETGFAMG